MLLLVSLSPLTFINTVLAIATAIVLRDVIAIAMVLALLIVTVVVILLSSVGTWGLIGD